MQPMQTIDDLGSFQGYTELLITGGEPLLDIKRTHGVMSELRRRYPAARLFLYTAWFEPDARLLWQMSDGVQFTIHPPAGKREEEQLIGWQGVIDGTKSNRLRIDKRIRREFPVDPKVWSDVQVCKWLSEKELRKRNGPTGLPQGERLFLYTA
jgi:hypothetical protein